MLTLTLTFPVGEYMGYEDHLGLSCATWGSANVSKVKLFLLPSPGRSISSLFAPTTSRDFSVGLLDFDKVSPTCK